MNNFILTIVALNNLFGLDEILNKRSFSFIKMFLVRSLHYRVVNIVRVSFETIKLLSLDKLLKNAIKMYA